MIRDCHACLLGTTLAAIFPTQVQQDSIVVFRFR
jgi:hypothetical protein